MKSNATTGVWRRTPLLDARFNELLKAQPLLTYTAIAERLSVEFGVHLTKNACIGHGRHTGVPKRQPSRSYAGRKGRKLKPRAKPYVPKVRLPPRFRPKPRVLGKMLLEQLHLTQDCHWPIGDRAPFLFCGDATVMVQPPYCLKHLHLACPATRREAA